MLALAPKDVANDLHFARHADGELSYVFVVQLMDGREFVDAAAPKLRFAAALTAEGSQLVVGAVAAEMGGVADELSEGHKVGAHFRFSVFDVLRVDVVFNGPQNVSDHRFLAQLRLQPRVDARQL
jgi:hypothetical protein